MTGIEKGNDSYSHSGWDDWEDTDAAREQRQIDERALREPTFDYYESYPRWKPKAAIGEYVASQGFNVPLIRDQVEWEDAFDNGLAMARSDMTQDYSGLSGLLSSMVIKTDYFDSFSYLLGTTPQFREELNAKLLEGLRSGVMSTADYMNIFKWPNEIARLEREASELGFRGLDFGTQQASDWRYIPGMNLAVFRDPSVDGRYHVKTNPDRSWVMGYTIDPSRYDRPLSYERSGTPVDIKKMISFYEAIRTLPRFDITQAPLIEMQMDEAGEFHFLQYLKTGHVVDPVEPFELPAGDSLIRTRNVRGATDPAGMEIRIYITPKRVTERMEGQGFYFSMSWPHGLGAQVMSSIGSVVVHEVQVGMKDNHWNSAPLYRPQVGMGIGFDTIYGADHAGKLSQMASFVDETREEGRNMYINARVVANGREATIESDWEPKFE